jgi:putative spermidine/putrescine transport system substrate-binding protein
LWDMQQLDAAGWVIPSGSKNVDAAMKFVRYATDTQRMADLTKFAPLGPTRKSALPLIGKHAELGVEMAPYVPTNAKYAARSFHFDPIWWADHRADMEKRFNTWLSQ